MDPQPFAADLHVISPLLHDLGVIPAVTSLGSFATGRSSTRSLPVFVKSIYSTRRLL
jgi:hypothetical protein